MPSKPRRRLRAVPDGAAPGILRIDRDEATVGNWTRDGREGHRFEIRVDPPTDSSGLYFVRSEANFGSQFTLAKDSPLGRAAQQLSTAHRPDPLVPSLEIHCDRPAMGSSPLPERLFLRRAELWGQRFILTDDAKTWGSFDPSDMNTRCPLAEIDPEVSLAFAVFALILSVELTSS